VCTFSDITHQKQAEAVLRVISQAHLEAEEAVRDSAERERAIARIIRQMRQTLDLKTTLSSATQELRQVIQCDRVLVYRFNPDWSGQFVSESVAAGWKVLLQEQIAQPELTQTAVNNVDCVVKTLDSKNILIQDTYLQETQAAIYRQGKSYTCVTDIDEAKFEPCYLNLLNGFHFRHVQEQKLTLVLPSLRLTKQIFSKSVSILCQIGC
jgi:two-component system sensor histidine kinase/response regulator